MAEESNALVKKQEFGQGLVGEAQKRYDDQRREMVFATVGRLLTNRDEALERERFYARAAAWYVKKLAALNSGDFEMDELTGMLTFNDADLNRANY